MNILPLLTAHLERYPEMAIEDAVKLLYQSYLGTGHSAPSFEVALDYINIERAAISPIESQPFFESIGHNRYRLALNAPKAQCLCSQTIARLFIDQKEENPNPTPFHLAIEALAEFIKGGQLPFSPGPSLAFLQSYAQGGYPSLHHSSNYRAHYHPSYRVVGWQGFFHQALLTKVDDRINQATPSKPFIIAIDGRCSSGKTSLAAWLNQLYPQGQVISMDDFFLPLEMKTEQRLALPGGNIHHERVVEEVLLPIKKKKKGAYRPFDCQRQTYQKEVPLGHGPLYIIEGSYSLHPALLPFYDFTLFLTLPYEVQKARILARNGEMMLKRFVQEWIPLEEAYFSHFKTQEQVDYTKDTSTIPV